MGSHGYLQPNMVTSFVHKILYSQMLILCTYFFKLVSLESGIEALKVKLVEAYFTTLSPCMSSSGSMVCAE